MAGPLAGLRVIEIGSIGPGPFAAMMLADHGAEVIRIDRPDQRPDPKEILLRSRKSITLDLKDEVDVAGLRTLLQSSDALIEGFRPGTMERLGLGPDLLLAENPRLVYGRMTGWGQDGPYARYAGHDINYIAISGALHAIGPADRPIPPLPLVGDFGGGGMLLAFALTAAMLEAGRSGKGQVIDCAMAEGAGLLMSAFYSGLAQGWWLDQRASNMTDGGAPYYAAYETKDALFVSIGSIEPKFYAQLLDALGVADDPAFAAQEDKDGWPALRARIADIIKTKTRDEWCEIMDRTDICFAPVLNMKEAPYHPQAVARKSFLAVNGIVQPAPAPRYSRTPLAAPSVLEFTDLDSAIS